MKSLHVNVLLRYNSIDCFADVYSSAVSAFGGTFGGMSGAKHKPVFKEGQFNATYRGYVLYFIVNLQGILFTTTWCQLSVRNKRRKPRNSCVWCADSWKTWTKNRLFSYRPTRRLSDRMEFAIQAWWSSYLKCDSVCPKKVDGVLRNCWKSFFLKLSYVSTKIS